MGDGSVTIALLELGTDTSTNKDGDTENGRNESDLVLVMDTCSNEGDMVEIDASSSNKNNGVGGGDENDMVGASDGYEEHIQEPKPGMVFSSEKAVHLYYTDYARRKGFGVMRRTSKPGIDGKVKYFTLACARGGKNRSNAKNPFSRKPSTKTECNGKIRAALCPDGSFVLTTVKLEHNHALSAENVQYPRCKKKLFPYAKKRPEPKDEVRMIVNKVRAGPLRLEVGDAEAICKFFASEQYKDPGVFNVVDIDDECRARNLFWADGRSRAAYEEFGDVVAFDTSYLTDKYDMPLATFIGVNHHGQKILLGCALLSNEDTKTFVWLFESWLDCMSRHSPKAIITDQGKDIQTAVERVFPNSRHRWCLWHIMKKLPEKLSNYSHCDAIEMALQNTIYDSPTSSEFEEGWRETIRKFDLHNNTWLVDLYDERDRWAPVYIKESFWAGMSVTRRDESMHPFFHGYVNFRTTVKQFVEQYDYILRCNIEKENQADYNSSNSRYECITHYDIEKQFQSAYSNTKFKEFQDELKGKIYCYPSLVEEQGTVSTYKVAEDIKDGDNWKDLFWKVCFNQEKFEVHCVCCLFEFTGILCRHALAVLTQRKVKEVPPKYILLRWRGDFKRKHNFIKTSYDDWSSKPDIQHYDKMCKEFSEIAAIAVGSDEKCNIVTSFICELKDKVLNHQVLSICQGKQQNHDAAVAFPSCKDDLNDISKDSGTSTNSSPLRSRRHLPTKRKSSKINQEANLSNLVECVYGGLRLDHSNLSASEKPVLEKMDL